MGDLDFYVSRSIPLEVIKKALLQVITRQTDGHVYDVLDPCADKTQLLIHVNTWEDGDYQNLGVYLPRQYEDTDEASTYARLSEQLGSPVVCSFKAPHPTAADPFVWQIYENGVPFLIDELVSDEIEGMVLLPETKRPLEVDQMLAAQENVDGSKVEETDENDAADESKWDD